MYAKVSLANANDALLCRACGAPAFTAQRIEPCGCVVCGRCALCSQINCAACHYIVISYTYDAFTASYLYQYEFICACGKRVYYAELRAHAAYCAYIPLACPNECGEFISAAKLYQHQEYECPKRLVSCEHCGLIIEADQIEYHLAKCGRMRVLCPNGCGEMICRGDANMHNQVCQKAYETCYFCGERYNSAEAERHFGNIELLGRHLMGFMTEFRASNEQIMQVYQDFLKRLAKLESAYHGDKSHTATSISDTIETPRIRTSLRVVPGGQQIGNERVGDSSLVLPLEFRVRNIYEVVTVPPAPNSFIEVKNIISNEILKIEPQQTQNYLFYMLSFTETGPFSITLRAAAGQELDRQDIEVLPQEFDVSNPNNIGQCYQFCASHQWLYAEPSRFFVVQSEGVQIYNFKIKRANTHVAFGFTESDNRKLSYFTCCLSYGLHENGEFRKAEHRFRANDDVTVRLSGDKADLLLNGRQIYYFLDVQYQSFYIEIADAEVWLV